MTFFTVFNHSYKNDYTVTYKRMFFKYFNSHKSAHLLKIEQKRMKFELNN